LSQCFPRSVRRPDRFCSVSCRFSFDFPLDRESCGRPPTGSPWESPVHRFFSELTTD
jgi:hypothetical protein